MYEYRAIVTKIYDGDTITVAIDLGFKAWQKGMKLRLYGINTPEIRLGKKTNAKDKKRGLEAKAWLEDKILGKQVILRTHRDKQGKYGRWLAEVYPADTALGSTSYNAQLVNKGMAVWASY